MSDSSNFTFKDYFRRLWADSLRHSVPWARDQIGWAALMVMLPALAALIIHQSKIDWPVVKTTLLLYAVAFVIYGVIHYVRAGYEVYERMAKDDKLLRDALEERTRLWSTATNANAGIVFAHEQTKEELERVRNELQGITKLTAEMREQLQAKDSEISRISKPDRCPIVLLTDWRVNYGVNMESGDPVAINGGFQLQSEGETAHEITLEEFEIEPSVTVASRMVPHITGHQIGSGFMLAWIKGKQLTDFSKWELAEAFRRASDKNTGLWKPNYCRTLHLTYRDHSEFYYRTTQELIYVPVKGEFEFGPIKHEKLGLRKSA